MHDKANIKFICGHWLEYIFLSHPSIAEMDANEMFTGTLSMNSDKSKTWKK